MADGADGGWRRLAERGSRRCDAGRGGSVKGTGGRFHGRIAVAGPSPGRFPTVSSPPLQLPIPIDTEATHPPRPCQQLRFLARPPRDWRRQGSHRSCRCRSKSSTPSSSSSTTSRSSPLRKHRALSGPSSTLLAMTLSSDCSPSSYCPNMAVSRPASAPATAPLYRLRITSSGAESSTPTRYVSSSARTCISTTTPSYAYN